MSNAKLKQLHRSHYLHHKKLKQLNHSRYLHQKIIETIKSFFLFQSLVKVTVNRSRYGIELKNETLKSFPLLSQKKEWLRRSRYKVFKKWNVYIVLITNVKLKLLHRSLGSKKVT
jgi:hypothetical protein